MTMQHTLMPCLLALLVALPAPGQDAASKSDLDRLQGRWKVVWSEESGVKNTEPAVLVFKGDKAILEEKGRPPEEATFKVDATKKPKQLDLLQPPNPAAKADKGLKIQAIYELDGDTLRICYRVPPPTAKDQTVSERPTQFGSAKGGTLMHLQREK